MSAVVIISSSPLTALPIIPEAARNIFENTRFLWGLCNFLNVPHDKRDNAARASEHFIQSIEPMKVRRMIWCLDWNGDTALADTVMECAEPPAGMYIFMWERILCCSSKTCNATVI